MSDVRRVVALVVAAALASCQPVPRPHAGTFHDSDAEIAVTRILHGSLVLSLRGTRFLVDPWFHSGIVRRQAEPLGLRPETLPPLAAVILTQRAGDHFDPPALRRLAGTTPRAVAPHPLREALLELGFVDVRGLGPWERTTIEGVTLTSVPSSGGDDQLGYVLSSGELDAYLAGDTRPFEQLAEIAARFPQLELACLPIGGRRLLGLPREMSPDEAAAAVALLQPAVVIPTHYGRQGVAPLLWQVSDPLGKFRAALARRGLDDRLVPLEPGESWHRL
jgi:L-ascorbate metabolism protein UlaG (beta-lactamase superfamily)